MYYKKEGVLGETTRVSNAVCYAASAPYLVRNENCKWSKL